jgi:hypothetical protein
MTHAPLSVCLLAARLLPFHTSGSTLMFVLAFLIPDS